MVNQSDTKSGAIGGTGSSTSMNYNTPAIRVGNEVRDGDEFILITRSKQSDGFQVWSSSDKQVTDQLFKQATRQVAGLETT